MKGFVLFLSCLFILFGTASADSLYVEIDGEQVYPKLGKKGSIISEIESLIFGEDYLDKEDYWVFHADFKVDRTPQLKIYLDMKQNPEDLTGFYSVADSSDIKERRWCDFEDPEHVHEYDGIITYMP